MPSCCVLGDSLPWSFASFATFVQLDMWWFIRTLLPFGVILFQLWENIFMNTISFFSQMIDATRDILLPAEKSVLIRHRWELLWSALVTYSKDGLFVLSVTAASIAITARACYVHSHLRSRTCASCSLPDLSCCSVVPAFPCGSVNLRSQCNAQLSSTKCQLSQVLARFLFRARDALLLICD